MAVMPRQTASGRASITIGALDRRRKNTKAGVSKALPIRVERLEPAGHAMRTDDGRRVAWIVRHHCIPRLVVADRLAPAYPIVGGELLEKHPSPRGECCKTHKDG
jgi:hypothetical protein